MHFPFYILPRTPRYVLPLRAFLHLLVGLVALLALACNPFSGDDSPIVPEETVEVNFDGVPGGNSQNSQQSAPTQPAEQAAIETSTRVPESTGGNRSRTGGCIHLGYTG